MRRQLRLRVVWVVLAAVAEVVAGCASPSVPKPPTLNMPRLVTDLQAARVGDEVVLRWTTPDKTTDKLEIKGEITAEVCRSEVAHRVGCDVVARTVVKAGASEARDVLTEGLRTGEPRRLEYRVQLKNAAGKTAGPSAAVAAAAGAGLPEVEGLKVSAAKAGVVVEWRPVTGASIGVVELERVTTESVAKAGAKPAEGLGAGKGKGPVEVKLRPGVGTTLGEKGPTDAGGMVDRTVKMGESYEYSAARVRAVTLSGESVEMRSVESARVGVAVRDVFPPEAPQGLVASPAYTGEGDGKRAAIDLAWEAGIEASVAGYRVYRREVGTDGAATGAWVRLNAELVGEPAYRDAGVTAGRRYRYRVTAVSAGGNESAASGEVEEAAPGQ